MDEKIVSNKLSVQTKTIIQQNGAKPDPQWLKIGEYDEDAGDLECKVLTPWKANN